MVKYTEKLLEKGAERKRLTKQLMALIGDVAKDIIENFPQGAPVYLEGLGKYLEILQIESNLGAVKFLGWQVENIKEEGGVEWRPHVFVGDMEPGTKFFLHNDPKCPVWVAETENYIQFANLLPDIAKAFEMYADRLNEDLRKAFDKLKEISGIGARVEDKTLLSSEDLAREAHKKTLEFFKGKKGKPKSVKE